MISGGVDYTPHSDPNEESIGISFDVWQKEAGKVHFQMWVGWSHGPVISDWIEHDILYDNFDNLITEVDRLIDESKETLFKQMETQMSVERPPVYRED